MIYINNWLIINVSILFEIDADPVVVTSKPFADITRHSDFPKEREVLFAIGSLFRIDHIEQNRDGIWIIQMTLSGENHPDLKILFDEMEMPLLWHSVEYYEK